MNYLAQKIRHIPVLVDQVLDWLITVPSGWYVDGTTGTGGHTAAIISRLLPDGRVLGIDLDPESLAIAREQLASDLSRITLRQGSYTQIPLFLEELSINTCQGILLDLGLSSYCLQSSGRGFSFQSDEPLDMRYDTSNGRPLYEVLPQLTPATLASILSRYGEERRADAVASAIHHEAVAGRLTTSGALADTVKDTVRGPMKIKSLARVFQALRIFINDELNSLETALELLSNILESGRRMVIISYHSLEDRLVKRFLAREAKDCLCPPYFPKCVCSHTASLKVLTNKPVIPTPEEIALNPRSRSAKLRVGERL